MARRNLKQNKKDQQSFWNTVPGFLTALAALITAIAGLLAILNTMGVFEPEITPTPVSTPLPALTPTLEPNPTQTLAPTALSTPTSTVSIGETVEDFEDNEAQGFNFEGDGTWAITDDGSGNMVLEVRTNTSSTLHIDLPPAMFTANIIEFQINFKEFPPEVTDDTENWGSLDVIFREQRDGQNSYLLTIRPPSPLKHIELNYVPPNGNWEPILEYPIEFVNDELHSLRLELQGPQISAFLDGNLMYSITDDRLDAGALVYLVGPDTIVQFDNIRSTLTP